MQYPPFQSRFCKHFGCEPEGFEERAFRELLYRHLRVLSLILFKLKPSMFARDLKFIHRLGEADDLREALACAADFQDANLAKRNFFRNTLKIRVSGWKATRLAEKLFAATGDPAHQTAPAYLTSTRVDEAPNG
jgi:hypothetical protein